VSDYSVLLSKCRRLATVSYKRKLHKIVKRQKLSSIAEQQYSACMWHYVYRAETNISCWKWITYK